jgi:putative transposase
MILNLFNISGCYWNKVQGHCVKSYLRIYPTKEQEGFLNQQFGATRFVYNKSLAIIKHQYKKHNKSLYAKRDIKPLLPKAKKSRKYN